MFLCVVVFLDPVDELAVEHVQRAEVEGAGKELVAHGPKKSFNFSFRCSIAHGGVME